MSTALFFATVAAYSAACALYIIQLGRTPPAWTRYAQPVLALGAVVHIAFIGVGASAGVCPVRGIQGSLTFFSVGIVLVYLFFARKYKLSVVGAFITPITLLMLISAHFSKAHGPLSTGTRGVLLVIHIASNLIGEVAFALAAALAVVYLLQQRRLKKKKLLGLGTRMPSLEVLDQLGIRCVTFGFPFLTAGIILGAIVAKRLEESFQFSAAQVLALLMWVIFAAVLALRVAVGWRGRRAAIGTILGFLAGLAVLVAYLVRSSPPGGGG